MLNTWCAECGAYVDYDPWSAHHVVVDRPFMPRHSYALVTLIDRVLSRLRTNVPCSAQETTSNVAYAASQVSSASAPNV